MNDCVVAWRRATPPTFFTVISFRFAEGDDTEGDDAEGDDAEGDSHHLRSRGSCGLLIDWKRERW